MLKRDELQRILQMLQAEVAKTGWLVPQAKPQADLIAPAADPKPVRH